MLVIKWTLNKRFVLTDRKTTNLGTQWNHSIFIVGSTSQEKSFGFIHFSVFRFLEFVYIFSKKHFRASHSTSSQIKRRFKKVKILLLA